MVKTSLRYMSLLCLLGLGACEGWEMQLTNTAFPYGNERTAGSGVMYVRAKMLPEKTVILESTPAPQPAPAVQPAPPPVQSTEPMNNPEPIFHKKMVK